jgi:ribosomal protein S18 acetylase RimI-like enzyme
MEFYLRRAEARDCAELLGLIQELADFEKAPDEVTVSLEHFIESGFGANPVWRAFVAVAPGKDGAAEKLVGFALYYIRYSTWKGQRIYLEDLLVTDEWRSKGVGTALMNALIDEAQTRKLHGISWQVLKWNENAIRFYERYGASFDGEWYNSMITL